MIRRLRIYRLRVRLMALLLRRELIVSELQSYPKYLLPNRRLQKTVRHLQKNNERLRSVRQQMLRLR